MKPDRAQLAALARRDPALGAAMRRSAPFPGFPNGSSWSGRTHFEALARAIVYQQLAGAAAATIWGRVRALAPGGRFPSPGRFLGLDEARLRGAGLSRNKLLALRDLAERCADGRLRLPSIGRRADEAIVEELVAVRGVGEWTAQMFLLFRLGRLDVMPSGDLGVREGLRRLDGRAERPSPSEVLARAEAWRPLCSVAAWTLWRVSEER